MKISACDVVFHMFNTKVRSVSPSIPERKNNRFCWLSGVLFILLSVALVSPAAGAEEAIPLPVTSESIKENYPEVYKKTQEVGTYREPVDPTNPMVTMVVSGHNRHSSRISHRIGGREVHLNIVPKYPLLPETYNRSIIVYTIDRQQ